MWRLLFTHHQHLGTGPLLKTAPLSPWHYQGRSPRSAPPLVKGEESASFGFLFSSKGSPARAISDARRGDFFVLPHWGRLLRSLASQQKGINRFTQLGQSCAATMRVEQRKSLEEQPWSRRLVLGERSRRSRIVPERSRIVPERSRVERLFPRLWPSPLR